MSRKNYKDQKFLQRAYKTAYKMKYRQKKTVVDGITFDSKKEAKRYQELKLLERAGEISDLELQVSFDLIVNGQKICRYISDFVYKENGKEIVEDTKSDYTKKLPVYRLKKKLMKACLGIEIQES